MQTNAVHSVVKGYKKSTWYYEIKGFFSFWHHTWLFKTISSFFLGVFVMVCIYLKICVLGKNYRNLSKTIGIFQTIH